MPQEPFMNTVQTNKPQRIDCPKCGSRIMSAATMCGYCWAKLTPVETGGSVPKRAAALRHQTLGTADSDLAVRPESDEETRYREAPRIGCPECGRQIMAAATMCGYCWARLSPVAA